MKILMVCLGNICRSPLAQGIMEANVKKNRLKWTIDSAGTSGWHAGEKPDERAIKIAGKYGVRISQQKSRKLMTEDFYTFDYILAMDCKNMQDILAICPSPELSEKVHLIMEFSSHSHITEVPDPYYDGNFQIVYNLLEEACKGFIPHSVAV